MRKVRQDMDTTEVWAASGLPEVSLATLERAQERFSSKVEYNQDGCWLWLDHRDSTGRGKLKVGGRFYWASRLALIFSGQPIPQGLSVCHHCDNPSCVKPLHLYVGTQQDNMDDMVRRGRNHYNQEEKNPQAVLTRREAEEIRTLYGDDGWSKKRLAGRFGVAKTTVHLILAKQTWR